jgi:phosphoglycerate kinase
MRFPTLDELDAKGKRVLLRADLNVPVKDGHVTDPTRLERLCPTIRELCNHGARVIVCSHFGRPKGKPIPEMSLRPVVASLEQLLGRKVQFVDSCVGAEARRAAEALKDDEVLVLENLRFDPREERNDPAMARELAALADAYVNDAFSAAHRAHASTEGIARLLPAYPGRLMQAELQALDAVLGHPRHPVAAIVGGAKVSTKLGVLNNLIEHVDTLALGGAMANTFLAAQGIAVGRSLQEAELHGTARQVLARAERIGCEVLLPQDFVIADRLRPDASIQDVSINTVPADRMILDLGARTICAWVERLGDWRTVVWNGPLGAFETPPFDAASIALAHAIASATQEKRLVSVAGGGDTLAALHRAGVADRFTYVSTAGGAFLEWLEGKTLPGRGARFLIATL